ncbi:MAG: phosphatidylserine decarboxylase family protein [Deltaproteobacteria bacterium]|nr:phosphatidylserine decarboxylase family protein [Deltaproteobacteria bacterium]
MGIAKEGYRFVLPPALLALAALALGWKWVALALGILALSFAGFFRDPERIPPVGEGLILSPADGKVVSIKKIESSGISEGGETRISVFLSPLDVHINRSPVRGLVEEVKYHKGRFFAAFREEASDDNERNELRIVDPQGQRLRVVQIAGVLARRIVCYVKPGDHLERGQKLGMIMFGSRVDLFVPKGSRVDVVQGQKVKGGLSVIGRFV